MSRTAESSRRARSSMSSAGLLVLLARVQMRIRFKSLDSTHCVVVGHVIGHTEVCRVLTASNVKIAAAGNRGELDSA